MRDKFESVKAAASHMADDLKGKAAEVVDELKHAASAGRRNSKARPARLTTTPGSERGRLHEDAEEYVRQQPRKSLLTAVAVGFVAGLLLRR